MDNKKKEKRDTPIIDGDARPDMPLDVNEAKKKDRRPGGGRHKQQFESERLSDINSLEDYKDAK